MIFTGQIKKANKKYLLIESDDIDLNKLSKFANGKVPNVLIDLEDERHISVLQRKKLFALFHDFSDFTGYDICETKELFKQMFEIVTGSLPFSLSNNQTNTITLEQANKLIKFVLDYMFENEIPFKFARWDWIKSDFGMERDCLIHRICEVCGKTEADIAHYDAVGMGNNRNKVDHRNYRFMSLCRVHHTEQHTIGLLTFCEKYYIKPIKLDEPDLIKLGLLTKQKIQRIEEFKND